MEKEVKVVKRTRARKPKTVEVVEAIVDDVKIEETVEVEEVVPRKTYRELKKEFKSKQHEIEVEVLNLNSCATSCRGRDGRLIFKFNNSLFFSLLRRCKNAFRVRAHNKRRKVSNKSPKCRKKMGLIFN